MNANIEQHPNKPLHLSQDELDRLLAEDGAGRSLDVAAKHLERCADCQSRLMSLAGGAELWSDAQTFLSGDSEPRWEPDTSQVETSAIDAEHDREPVHDVVARILGTPNHPEMLGRLGRYDIERVIGSGGMGIVLKAHDSELNRPIAIKLLAPDLAHVGAARERFAREGRAAAAVVHEHVVAIYNVESGGPVPFLVMQYVPGRSLQSRVDEDGPLGIEEILRIGVQAASGLAAAHRQGLVHRDVKPANILLENSVERAILTDFGLARAIDDASLTQTGILAGTPHYMSPEQAIGAAVDHRSDMFSLGAVLYFMATGRPPFRGSNALGVLHQICREQHRPVWQVNKDIPDELADAIDRMLEKKPGRRFASAEELQQELASLLARVQQQGLGRRQFRGWRGKRLRRKLVWAVAAAPVVGLIVGGASWFATWRLESPMVAPTEELRSAYAQAIESLSKQADAVLTQPDVEFFTDLGAAHGQLSTMGSTYQFFQQGNDPWDRELQSIQSDLSELESTKTSFP